MVMMQMQMQMQMLCHGVVIRFVISCLCLVGFTLAKCVPEKCGSMEVSYPFWINNSDCGYSNRFQINCTMDKDTGKMAPFLPVAVATGKNTTLETAYYKIRDPIDYSTGKIVIDTSSLNASSCRGNENADAFKRFYLPGPFYISMSAKFVVVGCNVTGSYTSRGQGTSCTVSSCNSQKDPPYCPRGCCELTLPDNSWFVNFSTSGTDTSCGFSTLMDPSTFSNGEDVDNAYYGLTLDWGISGVNCSEAMNTIYYSCSSDAQCIDSPSKSGYLCKCLPGFEGNGYSCTGCKDIDECRDTTLNQCVEVEKGGICQNLPGSYNCSCANGYKGDGFRNGTRCTPENSNKTAMFAAIGSVSAFVAVSLGGCGFFWWVRRHYKKLARKENFRCNGGDFLKQILPKPTEGKVFKIYSEDEIRKASQNYSDAMKQGSGSSGTVYKGVLANGTAVAIKKFREFRDGVENDENDKSMRYFVNEIVTLWSLNHDNIVSLLGCCLETPSPVLVYEFVDGGTIFQQLNSGGLCWQSRLEIAMGSADALAYLHSELDHPIIHRDVKSSNILVTKSDHSTAKVIDFGMSRLLCGNDAHLTTTVMSTRGYMDPDYFGTGVLNDKSDVYSFGVYLAELLTGKKPLSYERPQQEMVLSKLFLSKCDDNCLADILDPKIKEERKEDEANAVAEIARECLLPEGSKRPSMKEVKMRLRGIEASRGPALSIPSSHDQISSAAQSGCSGGV